MELTPGQTYAGKYRIVRVLGGGAMGAVYEAENVLIWRRVAIKVLHANIAQKADALRRFEREAQAAGRIGSRHIVEVLDVGELPGGERFMVMEFLEGSTLQQRIRSRGRLTPEEAAPIVLQILEGLGAAHQAEIIHRDLKPANVFLMSGRGPREGAGPSHFQGPLEFVKILDFGVSKFNVLNDEMSMTSTGAVLGTPFYMSPEQAKGSRLIDARSDLYAVGVILYECITGQVPFSAETFNELIFRIVLESPPAVESFVPILDPEFSAIIHKAIARQPGDRYQTADEFQAALTAWVAEAAAGPVLPPPQPNGAAWPVSSGPVFAPGGTVLMAEAPSMSQSMLEQLHPVMTEPEPMHLAAPQGAPSPWMPQPLPSETAPSTSQDMYVVPKQGGGFLALVLGLVGALSVGGAGLMVMKWSARRDAAVAAASASAAAGSASERLAPPPPAPPALAPTSSPEPSQAPIEARPSGALSSSSSGAPTATAAPPVAATRPGEPIPAGRAAPARAIPPARRPGAPRVPSNPAAAAAPTPTAVPGRRTISTEL
jgi:serine/threonine protein kinase